MHPWIALLLGLGAAGLGGEIFIRGAVGMAHAARLTTAVIGVTVAAFATSSPELSVAVNSALARTPQISLGDALGSNVVNVALILGLAMLIAPIRLSAGSLHRDFPVAVAIAPLVALLAWDGRLSRVDAVLMLSAFLGWLALVIQEGRRGRRENEPVPNAAAKMAAAGAAAVVGLALLVLAGRLVVIGAQGIGAALGLSAFAVGAAMVSVGTSIPELATTLVAQLRGHSDISLGNILGSNIFNGLFIVSVAALIHPIEVSWRAVALGLGFGAVTIVMAVPWHAVLGWRRGVVLLCAYAVYLAAVVRFG